MADDSIADLSTLDQRQLAIYSAEAARRQRSVGVAYLFLLLAGAAGAHQFYIGRPGKGCIYLAVLSIAAMFFLGGCAQGLANPDPGQVQEAAKAIVSSGLILGIVGVMWLWDLCVLPIQIRQQDDTNRRKLIAELQRA